MYLIVAFLLGIANFAMHKAVVESGHPFVEDTKLYFGKHFGRNGSYFLEFGILLGAMLFAYSGFRDDRWILCGLHRLQRDRRLAAAFAPDVTFRCSLSQIISR
jgi:hypothetical protein